jgi:hypothetical protein
MVQQRGNNLLDGTVQRQDLDVDTPGNAVIRKVLAGSGVTLNWTGPDEGTGDVTINAQASNGEFSGGLNVRCLPGSGNAFSVLGIPAPTNTGTLSTPALAATNQLTSTRRTLISTGTTAGTVASSRIGTGLCWRGNAANKGGFQLIWRFGAEVLAAGNRAFVGLRNVVGAPTNIDPLASTAQGVIGLAINANTGNWNLANNVSGTAPTVLDLGSDFPVNTTSVFEMILSSIPNGSGIDYIIKNLATDATVSNTLTTNIPTQIEFLAPAIWVTNNTTAANAAIASAGYTLTSKY